MGKKVNQIFYMILSLIALSTCGPMKLGHETFKFENTSESSVYVWFHPRNKPSSSLPDTVFFIGTCYGFCVKAQSSAEIIPAYYYDWENYLGSLPYGLEALVIDSINMKKYHFKATDLFINRTDTCILELNLINRDVLEKSDWVITYPSSYKSSTLKTK